MLKLELSKRDRIQISAIVIGLGVVTAVHYAASTRHVFWHEVFQRVYYLPIIVAALWYGLRGGLLAAGLAALLYLPHVVFSWHGFRIYQLNQYLEVALFFAFGTLTGFLSDQQKRQRAKLQETAQRLSEVYADLQRSFESLRRAERLSALGTLSAGLAHEIRNPLSAIEGALEIVGRPGVEASVREEFLLVITKELTRLNGMLNHFLKFARPPSANPKPTDVRALMNDVSSLLAEFSSSRQVRIHCSTAPGESIVLIDPDQTKEVVLNLAINAAEAMPGGGSINLKSTVDVDSLVIEVQDEGAGVREEDLQQIFDPFYSTKSSGTGLGLSVAQRIMEQQGGKIEARRNPDKGMTFSLVFPLPPAKSA